MDDARVRLVAIGGSAGAVEALQEMVAGLPADLDACVLVSVHISPSARSRLPQILSRYGPLAATHATDGQRLRPGTIVIAPPDHHLLVLDHHVNISSGPKVNRHRPSLDVMFTSTARWAGSSVVAVVLSGTLDDGAVGAALVDRAGGRVLVQDPADAQWPSMPRAALATVATATTGSAARLGGLVTDAVEAAPAWPPSMTPQSDTEEAGRPMSMAHSSAPRYLDESESHLTRLVCPDCQGSLAQVDLGTISFFRCHVGHQYSPQSLAAAQAAVTEAKLWTATSALEEQAALRRHLAHSSDPATTGVDANDAADHRQAAERAADLADVLKEYLG